MPVAIPIVMAVVAVAGVAMQTIQARQEAKFQSKVAKRNAQINEQNAERAGFASQVEAQDQDFRNRMLIGEEVSKQAGSGLSLGSGSFALQRKNLTELAHQDALRIRQAGDVEVHNFLTSAAQNRAESKMALQRKKNATVAGAISAVGAGVSAFSGAGGFGAMGSGGGSLISGGGALAGRGP
jgi:hypothetical protein